MISKKRKSIGKTIKRGEKERSSSYEKHLLEDLKDPREAAAYLSEALGDKNPEVFLLALRDVTKVHGGIGKLAEKSSLNRESLYRMLSEKGNPELQSLDTLLKALGFRLRVEAKQGV